MWSAICFNLDQSKILSSGNGLIKDRDEVNLESDLTCCTEEAQKQENDDTPDHISIQGSFQFTSFVTRIFVVHHGLCFMTWNEREPLC